MCSLLPLLWVALPISLRTIDFSFTSLPPLFMSYVVASKVKELLKGMNMMTAGEFADELSKEVENMIKKAGKRADANGRKTVQGRDL